ncbi:NAD(+) diphosphatase [Gilvimarinus agarilyticus]|uniref:NAD(+) diphosphatase n=1 Tax=Gilvimarinus sp. 2_MG-2023 TaxID=3062666 RepID=UPI001C08B3E7|nr:NAD(+) diphosphatase [Gilvimarinus sp. 2_MG-2023]MBU2887080.1 NAD(+) diphosphatase [Gilvimarinus agarilyticus]MDO6571739.1 NAD(+) diphosphatase [Gilvimarinus sp. 2_MG-2023]
MTHTAICWQVHGSKLAVDKATGYPCSVSVAPLMPGSVSIPLPGTTGDSVLINQDSQLSGALEWVELRDCLSLYSSDMFERAGVAVQLAHWWQSQRFCNQCGSLLPDPDTHLLERNEYVKACKTCDTHHYPRLNPCIIVLVTRAQECLLALHHRSKSGVYTTLAGYVEPGESIEQAVCREVQEEVGVKVSQLRYQYSQSWPFPGQLMLGFWAQYDSGELLLQDDEIKDAAWYRFDQLPSVPPKGTIARRLIDDFVASLAN